MANFWAWAYEISAEFPFEIIQSKLKHLIKDFLPENDGSCMRRPLFLYIYTQFRQNFYCVPNHFAAPFSRCIDHTRSSLRTASRRSTSWILISFTIYRTWHHSICAIFVPEARIDDALLSTGRCTLRALIHHLASNGFEVTWYTSLDCSLTDVQGGNAPTGQ
jgi:hypothetical protein